MKHIHKKTYFGSLLPLSAFGITSAPLCGHPLFNQLLRPILNYPVDLVGLTVIGCVVFCYY